MVSKPVGETDAKQGYADGYIIPNQPGSRGKGKVLVAMSGGSIFSGHVKFHKNCLTS